MKTEAKRVAFSLLMFSPLAAFAQPGGSPGGGVTWAVAAAAFAAGVAVGYYLGKSSRSSDDKDK